MATWRKVITSGSNAQLSGLFVSGNITNRSTVAGTKITGSFTGSFKGSFTGDGSGLTGLPSGAVTTYTNGVDNRVITSTGAAGINGEANLTFDGTLLTVNGSLRNASTVAASKITGSFTGSFKGDGSQLTGLPSGAVTGFTNGADNRVLTATSATAITGESNLTFDGSVLTVTGRANISTALTASTIQATGLLAGTTDTVIIRTAGNNLATRTINKNAWTTGTLVSGSGTSTQVAYWAPGNSLTSDAGMTYNAGSDVLTVGTSTFGLNTAIAGTLDANGGSIRTDDASFDLINTTATTVNFAGAGTSINIGSATGRTTVNNSLTVAGDLTVNGTTTIVNTNNLLVEDRFILLSSGSTTANDGGIVVQSAAGGTGFSFGYDAADDRWVFQDALSSTATSFGTITAYASTVQWGTAVSKPSDATGPAYGGSSTGMGNMWVSTDTGEIWIYT